MQRKLKVVAKMQCFSATTEQLLFSFWGSSSRVRLMLFLRWRRELLIIKFLEKTSWQNVLFKKCAAALVAAAVAATVFCGEKKKTISK